MMRRTMFRGDVIFSGQEADGYLVFSVLHHDVADLKLVLEDVVLRFNHLEEPTESIRLTYAFDRQIGRLYPDGPIELPVGVAVSDQRDHVVI